MFFGRRGLMGGTRQTLVHQLASVTRHVSFIQTVGDVTIGFCCVNGLQNVIIIIVIHRRCHHHRCRCRDTKYKIMLLPSVRVGRLFLHDVHDLFTGLCTLIALTKYGNHLQLTVYKTTNASILVNFLCVILLATTLHRDVHLRFKDDEQNQN